MVSETLEDPGLGRRDPWGGDVTTPSSGSDRGQTDPSVRTQDSPRVVRGSYTQPPTGERVDIHTHLNPQDHPTGDFLEYGVDEP